MWGSLHVDVFYSLSVSFNEQSQGRASKSTKTSLQGRGTPDSSKPTGSVRPRAYQHKMSDFHWRRVEKYHQIRWSYIFPQETLPYGDWCQKKSWPPAFAVPLQNGQTGWSSGSPCTGLQPVPRLPAMMFQPTGKAMGYETIGHSFSFPCKMCWNPGPCVKICVFL